VVEGVLLRSALMEVLMGEEVEAPRGKSGRRHCGLLAQRAMV
jgi:hypothetical protein